MTILFFAKEEGALEVRLKGLLARGVPGEIVEDHRSIAGVAQRFRRPMEPPEVGVFLTNNHGELRDILSLQPLLQDIPIVLVVPDREMKTIALAHRLRPRYFTDLQGDFGQLVEVVKRMTRDQALSARRGSNDFS